MSDNNYCPFCGRHCNLSEPHCERGEEYIRTGVIPEHKHYHGKAKHSNAAAHYEALDIDHKLIMNLRDSGHMIRFLFEGKGSQKRILIILNEAGVITQRELTERIGIQPGSASEVIGKLEDAGFIHRTPSENDKRTADIQLTESGKREAEEAAQQRKKRHKEMFSCLSEEEKETLLSLIEKLNSYWESHYHDKSCGPHGHHGPHNHHGEHGPHSHYEEHEPHKQHEEHRPHESQHDFQH